MSARSSTGSGSTRAALEMIFAAAGEFMAAFQLFAADQLAQYKGMAVFGSARLKAESPLFERIVALVAHLATRFNFDVVTGGGPGVMYAGNQGGHRAKGAGARIRVKTSKIRIPAEPLHGEYDLSMEFPWFEPRVRAFLCMARVFLVCTGGIGTIKELFDVLQVLQLYKVLHGDDEESHPPPLLIVFDAWEERKVELAASDLAGVPEHLVEIASRFSPYELLQAVLVGLAQHGTVSPQDLRLISFCKTEEEVEQAVARYIEEHYPEALVAAP